MIGVKKSPPIEDGRGGRKNSGVRGGATRVQMTRWGEEKQKKTKKKKCLTNVDKPRIPRNYDRRHQSGFPSLRSSPRFIHALSKKKKKKKIGPTNSRFSPLFDFANVRWLRSIEIDGTRKKFVLPIWDKWHFSNLSRDLPQFGKNILHSRRSCVHAHLWRVVFLLYLLHRSRLIKKWRSSSLRRMFRRA